ncbi:MAG: flavin reductase family protein [Carbonactinosporaceae bacterium]
MKRPGLRRPGSKGPRRTAPEAGSGAAPEVTQEAFRQAAGRFATGIAIVTARSDGIDHAMTANAFTSVSLDPLLALVCVERDARFHDAVVGAGAWAVSVLPASAHEASVWFATRGRPLENQLENYPHVRGDRTGAAILEDALAFVECQTIAVHPGGDHSIVVGEVRSVGTPNPEAGPLVYFRGSYRSLEVAGDRGSVSCRGGDPD